MRKVVSIIIFILLSNYFYGQELYCNVQVNTQQVEGTEKTLYDNMRTQILEFMNNTKWTNYNYSFAERIEGTILVTISNRTSSDQFSATLNIVLKRPVFNSVYSSTILNYIDKEFKFEYTPYMPFDFDINTFTSNITSVLAYYAYLFIALDFDTFTLNGGEPFYQKAEAIVSAAQNSNYTGWKSFENQKNRYWLVENLTNSSYQGVRKYLYEYHRLGLDMMYDDAAKGRANVLKALKYLRQVKRDRPNLFFLQLIVDAKKDEIINIFSEGTATEKSEAVNIMKELDPANGSRYDVIMK